MEPAPRPDAMPAGPEMATTDARARLELLLELGCGLLESGQLSGQTARTLATGGHALQLDRVRCTSMGRVLLLEAALPDGEPVSVSGTARTLDAIDCTRAHALSRVATGLAAPAQTSPGSREGSPGAEALSVAEARREVQRLRDTATPWWAVTVGMTMLAFFISMQVGVTWQAWVSAAVVQLFSSIVGVGIGRARPPKLFAIAVQSSAAGALATLLVQLGFVDPVGAAAAIAVNWLLLIPLPLVIGAVAEAVEADFLSALSRVASVAMAGAGIFIGGAFTFALGDALGMAHPTLAVLPHMPWPLVLVFSMLGAVANAFANGGRIRLVPPAALLGLVTAAVSQTLLLVAGLPALWSSSIAAIVLGGLSAVLAARTGYPQQVLALMGVTGALLPGIPVFFGILQEMGQGSGLASYGQAAAICVGIGIGVSLGTYLAELVRIVRR